jgi:hypothetical protein
MNLQEQILRIQEMMGVINESDRSRLYHLSNHNNRQSISEKGLLPNIGRKTKNWQEKQKTDNLKNYIYLMDYEPSLLEKSMYGFDVWEIDANGLELNLLDDPNHNEFGGWYITQTPIPPSNIKLVDSDEKYDDCRNDDTPEYCRDLDANKLLGL